MTGYPLRTSHHPTTYSRCLGRPALPPSFPHILPPARYVFTLSLFFPSVIVYSSRASSINKAYTQTAKVYTSTPKALQKSGNIVQPKFTSAKRLYKQAVWRPRVFMMPSPTPSMSFLRSFPCSPLFGYVWQQGLR